MLHKDAKRSHKVHDLAFNNSTDRLAHTYTIKDDGRYYRQLDDNSVWMVMVDVNSIVTWQEMSPGTILAGHLITSYHLTDLEYQSLSNIITNNVITVTPISNLGGNRVVMANNEYADNTILSTVGKAIGFTKNAVNSGSPVEIINNNFLDGFSGLTINENIYLSINGTITQTVPTTGYIQNLGIAISSTSILINIQQPLVLI
jgi:hypothetical protein